jgi:hypothetical protein
MLMMTQESEHPNQPREHRQRVLKGASIILGVNESEISCTVRNMNSGGAELRVPFDAVLPQEFLLFISIDNATWRCEQRWRMKDRMGIRFIEPARKPSWHY